MRGEKNKNPAVRRGGGKQRARGAWARLNGGGIANLVFRKKGHEKTRREAGHFQKFSLRGNRGELLCESCLLVCGVVLMQNALAGCGIDRRDRLGIQRVCRLFVAGFDSGKELLDTRLERGLDHFVLFRLLLGNQHALLRRFDIGHDITPSKWLLS